ncbi:MULTISPECIES: hypothetical protein [unclassified Rhizobium]|nr:MULTISPECIES: hypothetical protein [unclassified Rhizobium]
MRMVRHDLFQTCFLRLEQFQQKCEAVLRPELRESKEMEHFHGTC